VLDEAQHLHADLLEEVRMLDTLEGRHEKATFTLLVGTTDLLENLADERLGSLRQRLAVLAALAPFTEAESLTYLRTEFARCGGTADAFTVEAMDVLAAGCNGVPRLLNRAAGLALDLAVAGEAECIDAEAACEALERIGQSPQPLLPEQSAGFPGQFESDRTFGAESTVWDAPKGKASRRRAG
jgi:type II secretory pathway predicted ATPase ExeA